MNEMLLHSPTAATAVAPRVPTINLVNKSKRGLKDCLQADWKSDLKDLFLTFGAAYRILHV